MACQQDMLTGLRHRAVSSRNDQNRAVHLGRPGDHVLDVVGVTRAIDVSVVALIGLILDVGDINRNATFSFFRRFVDLIIGQELGLTLLLPTPW